MNEFEGQVIEDAIDFVFQMRHGLFSMNTKARKALDDSVDALLAETDGEWRFYPNPDQTRREIKLKRKHCGDPTCPICYDMPLPAPERRAEISTPIAENDNTDAVD